jgi:hypothetical protein
MMPPRAVLALLALVALVGCGAQPQQAELKKVIAAAPVVVDDRKLWRQDYEPIESTAITKAQKGDNSRDNIEMLAKLSQVHYNSMIAALNQNVLRKHTVEGEVVSRVAVQSYINAKLPESDPLYSSLLRRLALFEEKSGKFPAAETHLQQVIAAPVKPPYTARQMFELKMDLARMYMDGRNNDERAADLLDELLTEYKKDPTITDAHLILYDSWVKAKDRIHSDPKAIEAMRKLSKKIKRERAQALERETNAALKEAN